MAVRTVSPHRLFAMRNPRHRTFLLSLVVVAMLFFMLRREAMFRSDLSGTTSREAIRAQVPLSAEAEVDPAEPAPPARPSPAADPGTAADTNAADGQQQQQPKEQQQDQLKEQQQDQQQHKQKPLSQSCDLDLPHLADLKQRYSLEDRFEYYKRHIRFTRRAGTRRRTMARLDQAFVPDQFRTVNLARANVEYPSEPCLAPIEVDVPESPLPTSANGSDFIFGVSTTFRRLTNSTTSPINEWSYWLTDGRGHSNGGKLILLLLNASDKELESVARQLRGVGIDVDVYHSDESMEMAVRYLTIIPTLYQHPASRTRRWLVTCDDDTFFPNMHALVDRMAGFDAAKMLYVGTLSEDAFAVDRHGSQAFGGAGVFLSIPLAARVTAHYEECRSARKVAESNSGWGAQGDILLRKCIYENTDVRLTDVRDLWQLDIVGDPSGFYESGVKPLSVHHYGGGWHRARPYQTTKVAHACGEDCPLMRFRTSDDFVIANGYSVAWYPDGTDEINWDQIERTFVAPPEDRGWNYDYKMGPQRPALHRTGRKMSWELMESTVNVDGTVLQVYTRKRDDWRWVDQTGQSMSDIDGIVELVWTE